jgi:hypothetical protein
MGKNMKQKVSVLIWSNNLVFAGVHWVKQQNMKHGVRWNSSIQQRSGNTLDSVQDVLYACLGWIY